MAQMKLPCSKEQLEYIQMYVTPERRVQVLMAEADRISGGEMDRATNTYYVKNSADRGEPTVYQTGSKRAAARLHAGRDPLPEWTFEVWTEFEWQRGYASSTLTVQDL